ncbi:MAG: ABC transporter permease, partial [Gemmataceae bacterium]|nr:ABC transporter permease [Gemmataceae bacterium]
VPTRDWHDPRNTYILLFVLAVVVMWFGCNNASREIVKEEAIYSRERSVNLRIAPYLASKFLVLSAITTLQVGLLLVFVWLPLEMLSWWVPGHTVPPAALMASYPAQFLVFSVLGMAGVAMGLLLSACVSSPDRANALLPYVLIPQMILGGGFIAVTGLVFWVAAVAAPVYWGFRATHLGADVLPKGFPGHAGYGDGIGLPLLAMAAQAAAMLVLTYVFLRRKDV